MNQKPLSEYKRVIHTFFKIKNGKQIFYIYLKEKGKKSKRISVEEYKKLTGVNLKPRKYVRKTN